MRTLNEAKYLGLKKERISFGYFGSGAVNFQTFFLNLYTKHFQLNEFLITSSFIGYFMSYMMHLKQVFL